MSEGDSLSRESSWGDLHSDVVSGRREEEIKQKEVDLAAREAQFCRSEQESRQQREAAEARLAARREQLRQQKRQREADLAARQVRLFQNELEQAGPLREVEAKEQAFQRSRVEAQAQNALRDTLQRMDDLRRQMQDSEFAHRSRTASMTQRMNGLNGLTNVLTAKRYAVVDQRDAATAACEIGGPIWRPAFGSYGPESWPRCAETVYEGRVNVVASVS